jgi:hypothetical protein
MFITVITDCRDGNAKARQETRYATLFPGAHISFIGTPSEIEAAGNLVDVLDAAGDAEGIIAVNVAPRHGKAKKYSNGTPFGYFRYKNILVVCTVNGSSLALVKKLGLMGEVTVTDIRTVLTYEGFDAEMVDFIADSQFRSFDYLPRLAEIVWRKGSTVGEVLPAEEIEVPDVAIWWIDSFGNCKTGLLPEDVGFAEGEEREITIDGLAIRATCYQQLRSVPDNHTALTCGSSGYGNKRFLELVVQGSSCAKHYGLHVKDGFDVARI